MIRRRAPLSGLAEVLDSPRPPAVLDEVDRKLLELLALDARTSQRGLARALQMSPPAVGERIARLERAGVIRGYTVDIDWDAAGYPVTVYLAITAVQGSDLSAVITGLRALPEVSDLTLVTGAIDLLARLLVRDHGHLRELLMHRVWKIEGVQRTETFLSVGDLHAENFAARLIRSLSATHTTVAPEHVK